MTPAETAAILRQFNEWRRSDYEPSEQPAPPDPREISEAIDSAVEMMDEIERLRAELATEQIAGIPHSHYTFLVAENKRLHAKAEHYENAWSDVCDENQRLINQNAILTDAITAASQIMASAPAWHAMHREAIAELQKVKKEMEQ